MTRSRRGRARTTRSTFPPITVARFTAATRLLGTLTDQVADEFLATQQRYREKHAAVHPARQPNAHEAAQLAAALLQDGQDPVELAEQVQASQLRVQDRPEAREMLAMAGATTAPAVIHVGTRLYGLLRMDAERFRNAQAIDELEAAIDEECADIADMPMEEARPLAAEALARFLEVAGAGGAEGNPMGLIVRVVKEALRMALKTMGPELDRLSSSSLTGSPPSTAGTSTASSTDSPTAER